MICARTVTTAAVWRPLSAFTVPLLCDWKVRKGHNASPLTPACLAVLALREAVGIADSLYNLQLVTDFCRTQLPVNVAHLTVNDLFYIASDLKPNFLAFLADIFFLLEVQPAACVRDTSRAFVSSLVYTGMDNSHDTEDHGTIT